MNSPTEGNQMTDLHKAAQQALDLIEKGDVLCAVKASHVLRAALAQPDVPQGWVLVPVDPTPEMASAGAWAIIDGIDNRPETPWDEEAPMAYAAMLAAAPKGGV